MDADLVRKVQIALLSSSACRLQMQFKREWIAERSLNVAELIVETCGDRALDVAALISSDAHSIITSNNSRAASNIEQAVLVLDIIDGVKDEPVVEVVKDDDENKPNENVNRRRRPRAKPGNVTTPVDVSISQVGLDVDTVEKLLDAGVGTSVQALEYDANRGLAVLLGEETAFAVLAAVEDASKQGTA